MRRAAFQINEPQHANDWTPGLWEIDDRKKVNCPFRYDP
jgi:hypothetical protein